MADCYRANLMRSSRPDGSPVHVAIRAWIKVPHRQTGGGSSRVRQTEALFLEQPRALVQSYHASWGALPSVIEVGRFADSDPAGRLDASRTPYMVIERCNGIPLAESARARGVTPTVELLHGMLRGLQALHHEGYVHGSLSSSQVYVDEDARRGVIGFFDGIGKPKSALRDGFRPDDPRAPLYAAPELAGWSVSPGPGADIYAMGALLYKVVTGSDPAAEGAAHREARFPLARLIADTALGDVFERATADDPSQRPADAGELLNELCTAAGWKAARFKQPEKPDPAIPELRQQLPKTLDQGRYRVIDLLSVGGQGMVIRAEAVPPDKDLPAVPVLIKCIRYKAQARVDWTAQQWAEEIEESRRGLLNEARLCLRMRQSTSGVPQVLDFFTDRTHSDFISRFVPTAASSEPFLVMEEIPGHTLASARQRLSRNYVLRIARRIAYELVKIHENRLLYKDLKPENVIVDPWGGLIHLIDFGAACQVLPNGALDEDSPGYSSFTPGYGAPEFALSDLQIDSRFDVYSLGGVIYWGLTGISPEKDLALPEREALLDRHSKTPLDDDEFDRLEWEACCPVIDVDKAPRVYRTVLEQLLVRKRDRRPHTGDALDLIREREESLHVRDAIAPVPVDERLVEDGDHIQVSVRCRPPCDPSVTAVALMRIAPTATQVREVPVNGQTEVEILDPSPAGGENRYELRYVTEQGLGRSCSCVTVEVAVPPTVQARGAPGRVFLRWRGSAAARRFFVRRDVREPPRTTADGEELAVIEGVGDQGQGFFRDDGVSPGVHYHYSVFAQFGEHLSDAGSSSAVPLPLPETPVGFRGGPSAGDLPHVAKWTQKVVRPEVYGVEESTLDGKPVASHQLPPPTNCPKGHDLPPFAAVCPRCGAACQAKFESQAGPGEWRVVAVRARVQTAESGAVRCRVVGRAGVRDLRAESRVGRVVLRWTVDPALTYQVERSRGSRVDALGTSIDGTWHDDAPPGTYQYRVSPCCTSPEGEVVTLGARRASATVFEAIPNPAVHRELRDRTLDLSWDWPPADPIRPLEEIAIRAAVEGESMLDMAVRRDAQPRLTIRLDRLGEVHDFTVVGRQNDEISADVHSFAVVPTQPVEIAGIDSKIGRVHIRCRTFGPVVGLQVVRLLADGTRADLPTAQDTAEVIDRSVPPETRVRYEVRALYPPGTASDPTLTSPIRVFAQPPAPENLEAHGRLHGIELRWQVADGSNRVTGWRIETNEGERDPIVLPRATQSYVLDNVTPWTAVGVRVRPMIRDESGAKKATTLAWAFDDPGFSVSEAVGHVDLRWAADGEGTLHIFRAPIEGAVAGTSELLAEVPVASHAFRDVNVPLNRRHRYTCRVARDVVGLGPCITPTLERSSDGGWDACPRSEPPEQLGPGVRVRADGVALRINWGTPVDSPAVDRVRYVLHFGSPPAPGTLLDVTALDALLGDPAVRVLGETPPREAKLRSTGDRGWMYQLISNQLVTRVSRHAEVIGIPIAKGTLHEIAPPQTGKPTSSDLRLRPVEFHIEPREEWQVLIRCSAQASVHPNDRLGKTTSLADHVVFGGEGRPAEITGENVVEAIGSLQRDLLPEGCALPVAPGQRVAFDLTDDEPGCWNYTLHTLIRAGGTGPYLLSPARALADSCSSSAVVHYRWVTHDFWLWRKHVLHFWSRGVKAGARIVWSFDSDANVETATHAGSLPAPGSSRPRAALVLDESNQGKQATLLPVATGIDPVPVDMPRSFPGWLASLWCAGNKTLVVEALRGALGLAQHVDLDVRSWRGGFRVRIPRSGGGGWLRFMPLPRASEPIVRVSFKRWWWFSLRLARIDCTEEPWLRLDGIGWQAIARRFGGRR